MRSFTMAVLMIACGFCCSGCTTIVTPQQLRAEHALFSQFEIDSGLQATVKNITNKAHECKMGDFQEHITLLEEFNEANIVYRLGDVTFLLVDLSRQGDKTHVAIYSQYKVGGWKRPIMVLEYGAKGMTGCPQ